MKSRFLLLAAIGFLLQLTSPAEGKVTVDLAKATDKKVTFIAVGRPSALKIEGVGDGLSGVLTKDGTKVDGEAVFNLSTFDTGVTMRNTHMKEKYLHVETYPNATLKVTKLPWGADEAKPFAEVEGPFEGVLTLHGVSKPVTGVAKVARDGDKVAVDVQFKTSIPDYKIDIPSFMGVTVAETVEVHVEVSAPVTK